ncbi:MAG: polysaccharide deacetylase family protein, partial [Lachnospiraceae bacterium]
MKRMRRKLISVFIILILVLGIGCYFQERTGTEVSVVERKEGYILPIYCVQTEEPWVSLTFDSAWGTEDLDDILNILKDNEVPACFFVTGEWVDTYPGAVKKIVSAGHEIGSHGDKHKHMSALSVEENRQELEQCNRKIENVTGSRTKLFRAPYGDYDEELIKTVTAEGYYTIQWDVDSLDWKDYGVDAIIKRVS